MEATTIPQPDVPHLVEKMQSSFDKDEGSHRTELMSDFSQTSASLEEEGTEADPENDQVVDVNAEKPDVSEEAKIDTEFSHRPQRRGSLRASSEPLHVKERRGSWKCLPPLDMEVVLSRNVLETIEPPSKMVEQVRFGFVQFRSYSQTIGDNPSVSYGTPIQLDWEYEEQKPIALDVFELNRAPRRSLRQMVLSYYHRRNVLQWQYGVTEEEIKAAKRDAKKAKAQRSMTNMFMGFQPIEAAFESAGRKTKRALNKEKKTKSN